MRFIISSFQFTDFFPYSCILVVPANQLNKALEPIQAMSVLHELDSLVQVPSRVGGVLLILFTVYKTKSDED